MGCVKTMANITVDKLIKIVLIFMIYEQQLNKKIKKTDVYSQLPIRTVRL